MYLDIDITILPRSGEGYPFTLHTLGGDARGVFVFPDGAEFQQLQARLAALDTDETTLSEIGQKLFTALFRGQARDVLARTQGMCEPGQRLRLRLSIAAEEGKVAALPWELLHDPDAGPLVLTDTPLLRYIPIAARTPTVAATLPLQVLLTGAAGGAANVLPVLEEIRVALGTLGDHAQVVVEPALTTQLLQRRLREGYHVWHHVGQGGASESAQGGVLLFSDGANGTKAVSASQLAVLLGSSGLRLVVLDASNGARLATDPFRTIVPALMKTQIPTVVAMQFSVPEQSSQAFAGEFYRALAEGMPIDACVTEGRRAVMGQSGLGRPDWATPAVYSRAPDNQLFQVPRADTPGRIVTLGGTPGLPPNTSVSVDSQHGTLLHAGPRPSVERLVEKPRPPRALRAFFNRERELRSLVAEIRPRQGSWVRGPAGAGISALLRQAANVEAANALPDGVLLLNSTFDPADASDAAQEIFDRYYRSDVTAKLSTESAKSYLGGLRALFIFDHLPLPGGELVALTDTLAEGAVLIAAQGPAPDVLQEVTLGPLPRQDATKLIGAEAGAEIDLSNVMFLDRICAALQDLPLALQLAGRLLRVNAVPIKQLVALTEEPGGDQSALARAAAIALKVLDGAETNVLAAVVRGGPAGISPEAIAAISRIEQAKVEPALERMCELKLIEGGGDRYSPTTMSLGRVLDRLLKPGEERRRAAAFFAGVALLHAGNLDWFSAEEGNLAQAVETLLAEGKANEAGALLRFMQPSAVLHGRWGMWGRISTWAERAATAANDPVLRAWALHERGTRAGVLGDRAIAQTALQQASQLHEAAGDATGLAFERHNLRHIGLAPPPLPHATNASAPLSRRVVGTAVTISVLLAILALLAPRIGWPFGPNVPVTTPTAEAIQVVLVATEPATVTSTDVPTPSSLPTRTSPPTSAPSATATPEQATCRVIAERLNARTGPGTNYPVLATLADGQSVTPTGRSEDSRWLRISADGIPEGWISADVNLLACNVRIEEIQLSVAPPSPTPTRRPRPTTRPTTRPVARPTATSTPPPPTETPSVQPPSETPIPPSETPIPPTETPLPSSETPTLKPTSTPLPTNTLTPTPIIPG